MNVLSATTYLTEPWTIRPTRLEREFGRLLRSPEGHEETTTETTETETEKSLVTGGNEKTEETQTTETKTEETKTEEKVEETSVEPIKVDDIKLPEGFELKPELANEFIEIINDSEKSLTDKANALVELHTKNLALAQEADSAAWDKVQDEWKTEAKADQEVGGPKLQPTLTNIAKLVDEFGSDDLRKVFDLTGAGNNVHMIKFLGKIADVLTEGKFFKAGSPGADDGPDAVAKRMYPSMKG
jgi:hypothetical protein